MNALERPAPARPRRWLALLALAVVPLGLASRSALPLPAFVRAYAGDTLWALVVFLLVLFVAPAAPVARAALIALAIAFAVELSQLYREPWIEAVRRTLPGRLVLGRGFLWSDLLCYSAGVLIGVGLDRLLPRRPPGA